MKKQKKRKQRLYDFSWTRLANHDFGLTARNTTAEVEEDEGGYGEGRDVLKRGDERDFLQNVFINLSILTFSCRVSK